MVSKVAISLQQAKPAWVIEFKITDAQFFRIPQRTSQPSAGAGMHEESVRVMHFRAPILRWTGFFFAEEKHARQRRDAQFLYWLAKKQPGAHVNDRAFAGLDSE